MGDTKHTPGKWRRSDETTTSVEMMLAAPEMLSALEGLVREAKRLHVDDILGPGLAAARAAIEKARGGR